MVTAKVMMTIMGYVAPSISHVCVRERGMHGREEEKQGG
jgi:hypothetical protein